MSTLDVGVTLLGGWDDVVARGWTAGDAFASRQAEHDALRTCAAADLGLARILDGHRNAIERLLHHRPTDIPDGLRAEAVVGDVPLGVWGANPQGAEGEPARLSDDATTISGVKTFCSGAGLVGRALVLARPADGTGLPRCAYVDLSDPRSAVVDESWYAGVPLRSSRSHRVVFADAPVLAVLGGPGALSEQPWFSGDALRTAVTWVGALDAVVAEVDATLGVQEVSDSTALLVARLHAARASADRWLDHATRVRDEAPDDAPRVVLLARLEISERIREGLRLAAELMGSHAIVTGSSGARARQDLDLLLLQHRLTPAAVRLGHELLRRP